MITLCLKLFWRRQIRVASRFTRYSFTGACLIEYSPGTGSAFFPFLPEVVGLGASWSSSLTNSSSPLISSSPASSPKSPSSPDSSTSSSSLSSSSLPYSTSESKSESSGWGLLFLLGTLLASPKPRRSAALDGSLSPSNWRRTIYWVSLMFLRSALRCCFSTENCTGFFRAIRANSLRSWFSVAESMSVYLLAFLQWLTISSSSCLKPISMSLSASSRTSTSTSSRVKPLVLWM
mmetsp:Transcript_1865/g.2541  ORF Transcript_1865/g.2541 Transcript_1865/m.2541 type:complete len:234 (-) Transcript_1865:901-1602(-)